LDRDIVALLNNLNALPGDVGPRPRPLNVVSFYRRERVSFLPAFGGSFHHGFDGVVTDLRRAVRILQRLIICRSIFPVGSVKVELIQQLFATTQTWTAIKAGGRQLDIRGIDGKLTLRPRPRNPSERSRND